MTMRTTKAERRDARRALPAGCQRWGTARTARLLRGAGPHMRWALRIALALDAPPEVLISGNGPTVRGQYWAATGEVFDAPYNERMKARVAQAMGEVCADLDRTYLRPELERLGLDPDQYTVGFDLTGTELRTVALPGAPLAYEPPPSNTFGFELPADWGRS